MKKALYFAIAIMFLLGGSVFIYFTFFSKDGIPSNQNLSTTLTTYTNPVYSYSFQYPSTWTLTESDGSNFVTLQDKTGTYRFNYGSFWVKIEDNQGELTANDWITINEPSLLAKGFSGETNTAITEKTIGGLAGTLSSPKGDILEFGGSLKFFAPYRDKMVIIYSLAKDSGLNDATNGLPEKQMQAVFDSLQFPQ